MADVQIGDLRRKLDPAGVDASINFTPVGFKPNIDSITYFINSTFIIYMIIFEIIIKYTL